MQFNFKEVPGINYTKCNAVLFTSSTASTGTFSSEINATLNMNLSVVPQVLTLTSTDALKAGLWYYKKDLMWTGVGIAVNAFQILIVTGKVILFKLKLFYLRWLHKKLTKKVE